MVILIASKHIFDRGTIPNSFPSHMCQEHQLRVSFEKICSYKSALCKGEERSVAIRLYLMSRDIILDLREMMKIALMEIPGSLLAFLFEM